MLSSCNAVLLAAYNAAPLTIKKGGMGHMKLGSVNQRDVTYLDVWLYQSQAHIYKPINV